MSTTGNGTEGKRFSAYLVALLATSVLVPGLAALFAVLLYLSSNFGSFSWFVNRDGTRAFAFGTVAALGGWLLVALAARNYARAAGANPAEYAKLHEIYDVLNARADGVAATLPTQPMPIALIEARVNLDYAKSSFREEGPPPPSLRWGTGDAYLELRERLHRAEEALIDVEPVELALGEAQYDVRRVDGSRLADAKQLLDDLQAARTKLEANSTDIAARAVLRQVRRAVNEYRDSLRAGLVRARNRLFVTAVFASLFAYALLGVAMIWHVGRSQVLAATVIFLIGATVGLFRQLQLASTATTTQEDYGLETMRLIQTPLFSGLAAIGGVVLTSILLAVTPSPTTRRVSATPTTTTTPTATAAQPATTATTSSTTTSPPTATATAEQIPSLNEIFDIGTNPITLAIAAVFGLTPTLLISRLRAQSEALKTGLKSSELGGSSSGA
jgi:hypothetical protein